MFHIKNHQRQLIFAISKLTGDWISELDEIDEGAVLTVHTSSTALGDLKTLDQIIGGLEFTGDIYKGFPSIYRHSTTHWYVTGFNVAYGRETYTTPVVRLPRLFGI